jgi:hypothetical protein
MRSYLKTATVHIASLGESLEVRQLSAAQAAEVIAAKNDPARASAIAIKHGVPAWCDETAETIAGSLSFEQMHEIQTAITDIGASDPKLRRVRADGSIST